MIDITREIIFKTARSGGSGGQNVNKVETMVEGYWDVESTLLFSEQQKLLIKTKLANKINATGSLLVKSQTERSQLGNKAVVIKKMNAMIAAALIVPKKRRPTKIPKSVKEKILQNKKRTGELKQSRKKIV